MAVTKPNWDEVYFDIKKLADKINRRKVLFEGIYGIPRGGLVIAICLSYLTKIPIITDKRQLNRKTLVVDDITESGKTLKDFITKYPGKYGAIATIWYSPMSKVKPDYFVEMKAKYDVKFPWE